MGCSREGRFEVFGNQPKGLCQLASKCPSTVSVSVALKPVRGLLADHCCSFRLFAVKQQHWWAYRKHIPHGGHCQVTTVFSIFFSSILKTLENVWVWLGHVQSDHILQIHGVLAYLSYISKLWTVIIDERCYFFHFCHSKLSLTRELQGSLYFVLYHFIGDINHFYGLAKQGFTSHWVQPAASRQGTSGSCVWAKFHWPHTEEPYLNLFHYHIDSARPWIKPLHTH